MNEADAAAYLKEDSPAGEKVLVLSKTPQPLLAMVRSGIEIKEIILGNMGGESLGLGGYLDIGLYDTMGDLIVNLIGAVVFSVIGYFHQKHRKKSVVTQLFVPQVDEKEEDVQHE